MRRTRAFLSFSLVATSLFGGARPSLAATPTVAGQSDVSADIARSRALYREAQTAFENGLYPIAQQKLLQAWALRKTFDVAAALTQADLELREYRNAAEHAEYCLRVFAPAESDATLKSVLEMYAEAKKHIGTLQIRVRPDGAEVTADGNPIGTAPLASPLFLEPGEHSVQVRLGGAIDGRKMRVEAGKEYEIGIELIPTSTATRNASSETIPLSKAVPDPSPPNQTARAREFGRVYWTLGIGGTVTVAGLVTGLAYHAQARSKQDEAAALQARTPTCANVSSADCARLATVTTQRNRANSNAQIWLGAAGIAAFGTVMVTYLVWPARASSDSVKTSAWVTPNSAGFGLFTQF